MNELTKILDNKKVELSLGGHSHYYQMSVSMDCNEADKCKESKNGTVFMVVGSASGGRVDKPTGTDKFIEKQSRINGFTDLQYLMKK